MLSPIWINQTITLGPYSWFLALLNTILPGILHRKLMELFVDVSLCIWLWNFLLERLLFVKMASSVSRTISLNTGPPSRLRFIVNAYLTDDARLCVQIPGEKLGGKIRRQHIRGWVDSQLR